VFYGDLCVSLLTSGRILAQVAANSTRSVYRTGSHKRFPQHISGIFSWGIPLLINLISYMTTTNTKGYKKNAWLMTIQSLVMHLQCSRCRLVILF
jgi:hypothetical protein